MPNWDYIIEGGGFEAWGTKPTDDVTPKAGYGGHPLQTRPKRKALTVYEGRQPFSITVPMILWRDGGSVEADRIAIENMATTKGEIAPSGQPEQPPHVKIKSKFVLPVPPALGHQDEIEWWIEDLEWGEEFRNPPEEGGFLTWKLVTVTLLESAPEILLEAGAISAGTPHGRYRVKQGDTLKKIAAKFAKGNVSVIKQLNPKIRSDGVLKKYVGKFITVPEPLKEGKPTHVVIKGKPRKKVAKQKVGKP